MNNEKHTAKYITRLAMLCAAAILCSYAETLIPVQIFPVPGFRIGLANVAIMLTLYRFSLKEALVVNVARSILVSLLFSGVVAMMFSLVGGTLAVIAMYFVKKSGVFSIYGVGVSGAVMHNLGQTAVAIIVMKSAAVAAYLPYLMLCSLITGLAVAFLCGVSYNTFCKIVDERMSGL